MDYSFPVIGLVHSCFKEKFGIPRQPGLAPLAQARIEILPPYNDPDAFVGLAGSSHIWLQFVFHQNRREEWKPKIKPPRLGGNKTLGVFATRSPVRPAPIGLSVVQLLEVQINQGVQLLVGGADLLDGTPILDIKPYIPYTDKIDGASNSFAPAAPTIIPVIWPAELKAHCSSRLDYGVNLVALIEQILQQDPKPPYHKIEPERIYGMRLFDGDLRWRYAGTPDAYVIEVVDFADK